MLWIIENIESSNEDIANNQLIRSHYDACGLKRQTFLME